MSKTFKWVIEIEVDEVWVVDGFDLTDNTLINDLISNWIPHAIEGEVKAKVISSPNPETIKEIQGY